MLDKHSEYTYPAYFKKSYSGGTVTFPDFPNLSIEVSSSMMFAFWEARSFLQKYAEKAMYHGYILPKPTVFPSDDSSLGELFYITIYCEPSGFFWSKSFLDCCIVYTVFIVCLMFLLGATFTPFLFVAWLVLLLGMLLLTGVVSLFSHYVHDSLPYGKVPLVKRLISILGLCVVAAGLTWLLWNSGIK